MWWSVGGIFSVCCKNSRDTVQLCIQNICKWRRNLCHMILLDRNRSRYLGSQRQPVQLAIAITYSLNATLQKAIRLLVYGNYSGETGVRGVILKYCPLFSAERNY